MDRNESANEGGSSPDTVIARSSSEEERNRLACSTSGEYVTVGDSSSSLDTVTSVGTTTVSATTEDKKRGRFGALKSSFRKEGGLFKIKKKSRQLDEPAAEPQPDVEEKGSFFGICSFGFEENCCDLSPPLPFFFCRFLWSWLVKSWWSFFMKIGSLEVWLLSWSFVVRFCINSWINNWKRKIYLKIKFKKLFIFVGKNLGFLN